MADVPAESSGLSPVVVALRTCLISIIALLIISGNILVIAVARRVTNLADSTKVLMTSLAVFDLLIGCLAIFDAVASAMDTWPFGVIGCKAFTVVTTLSFVMSVCTMILLNVERFIAITRPYKFPVWCSRHRVILAQCILTTLALICSVSTTISLGAEYSAATPGGCFLKNDTSLQIANLCMLFILDLIPVIILTCIYYRLIRISRRHARRRIENRHGRDDANAANPAADNRALKTFLVVTVGFAFFCTPHVILRTVVSYTGDTPASWLHFLTIWLSYCNSAFNVFVYCLFIQSFRVIAKRLVFGKDTPPGCCKRSVEPVDITE